MRQLTLTIDFDGTIVEEAYPGLGKLKPEADKYINKLYDEGFNILIHTCRTGSFQGDAENYLRRMGVNYHYINSNLPKTIEFFKNDCRKLSADIYIDDKCLMGLPPTWKEIYDLIQIKKKYYEKKAV